MLTFSPLINFVEIMIVLSFQWFSLLVKDNHTGLTLLEGRSEGGLYPLHLKSFSVNKQHALTTFLGVKTYAVVWHSRLSHASQPIVSHLLQQFSLPINRVKHLDGVCKPCQLGKSKQLPFQPSPRVSLCPLDLIHSDVWSCSTKSLVAVHTMFFLLMIFSGLPGCIPSILNQMCFNFLSNLSLLWKISSLLPSNNFNVMVVVNRYLTNLKNFWLLMAYSTLFGVIILGLLLLLLTLFIMLGLSILKSTTILFVKRYSMVIYPSSILAL
jgi:hypothetical protein